MRIVPNSSVSMSLDIFVFYQVYDTHMKENLMKIMALFPNTVFLRTPLSRYIMQLPLKRRRTPEKHVKNIILFFDQLLRRFPDNYAEIPLDSLVVASMSLDPSVQSEVSTQVQVSLGSKSIYFSTKVHIVYK